MSRVIEAVPHGMVLTDARGIIVMINNQLARMFGYERDQLLNRSIEMLVPERFRKDHAALRAGYWQDPQARAMGAGRELYGLRADGTEFPVEIGLSSFDSDEGKFAVASVVDITERKHLELLSQRAMEAAPCGMLIVDAGGLIVHTNAQLDELFGYARNELVGKALEVLVPERTRGAHTRLRQTFTQSPSVRQMGTGRDLTAVRRDGGEFPIEIGLSPFAHEGRKAVLATVTDITRRKSMESRLQTVNRDLEEFTYVASHDLKSPLRGIGDLTDWISEELGEQASPGVKHNLERITTRVRRLERIIDDLLHYATAGGTSAEQSLLDPRELLASIIEILAAPPGFRIDIDVRSEPFVTVRTPLETVLRNLISNAVKHHDRTEAHIEISAKDEGPNCVFTVKDDGPGIPPGAQSRVFRMFQTVHSSVRAGSGIGLAVAKRLTEAHGGRITLEVHNGARGSTFQVSWPRFQWVEKYG
jgi:PAS domain S-box-containing protein